MPTDQIFRRVVWYGLLLSAVDAVSGRLLQAAPDPSVVLSLGATAWVAYRLAESKASGAPDLAVLSVLQVLRRRTHKKARAGRAFFEDCGS